MKDKKVLIILIIAIVVAGIALACVLILGKESNTENNVVNNNEIKEEKFDGLNAPDTPSIDANGVDCTKKGNVCDKMQIGQGILKSVKVNDKQTIDFYMLSNDENTMTLISKDILFESTWNDESLNFVGPSTLLKTIYENTKDWTKVKPMNYEYIDKGNTYYNSICEGDLSKDENGYKCIIGQNGVGYTDFKIDAKGYHFKTGEGDDFNLGNGKVYARTLTVEEASSLISYNYKINWLSGSEPFWTLTSDGELIASMIYSAYVVTYNQDVTTNYVTSFRHANEKLGVRPVITIDK